MYWNPPQRSSRRSSALAGKDRPLLGRLSHVGTALRAASRYALRRGLGARPRSLGEIAEREFTLSPCVEEPAIRPIILDAHVGRIQGGDRGRSANEVVADLNDPRHLATATRAFVLKDVVLFDKALYCGMHKEDLFRGKGFRATLFEEPSGDLPCAVWGTTHSAARWFGHLLHDELPLQELASPLGVMVGHARTPYVHEAGWRQALGVPSPAFYGSLRIRELLYLDDVGQNPGKRERYAVLKARLARKIARNERVVLLRGRSGGEERRILNEEEVLGRLAKEGFQLLETAVAGADEIISRCGGAAVVVSVEGSHASPALYLARPRAPIVYLYPPRRVSVISPQLATFFGLTGVMFVGEPVEASPAVFRVDPEELCRLIDRVCHPRTSASLPGAAGDA